MNNSRKTLLDSSFKSKFRSANNLFAPASAMNKQIEISYGEELDVDMLHLRDKSKHYGYHLHKQFLQDIPQIKREMRRKRENIIYLRRKINENKMKIEFNLQAIMSGTESDQVTERRIQKCDYLEKKCDSLLEELTLDAQDLNELRVCLMSMNDKLDREQVENEERNDINYDDVEWQQDEEGVDDDDEEEEEVEEDQDAEQPIDYYN